MKVDALPISGKGPNGERSEGLECSECGQKFFDAVSEEFFPRDASLRIVESAVANFINHADEVHHATGGTIGGGRRQDWRVCA